MEPDTQRGAEMTKAILYNDLWDFYDHDSAETRCFFLPIEEEELEPYLVDYEPAVHSYWKLTANNNHNICAYCGTFAPLWFDDEGEKIEWLSDYCPHCGAIMDEEGNK